MMSIVKKRIALHIQSEVQYFSVAPLLDELKKKKYDFTILIDDHKNDTDEDIESAKRMKSYLQKKGWKSLFFEDCRNKCYDLFIAPYVDGKIKAKCYLKYEYGTLNIKPNLTYVPHYMDRFNGFLCQSTTTANLLSVYGKTFLVDNLRFWGVKKKKKSLGKGKKRILFAPTFNDELTEKDLAELMDSLREEYYVIVKSHHGTEYLRQNDAQRRILVDKADEYYGPETKLTELIMDADLCVFGNSSAVGEALYAGVPCIVIAKNLDYFRLGDLHTTLFKFAEDGDLLVCGDVAQLRGTIKRSLAKEYLARQRKLAKRVFPISIRTGVKGYIDVIDYFLWDKEARDYVVLHNYMVKEKYEKIAYYEFELKCAEENSKKMVEYKERLDEMEGQKLHRLADKVYAMERKMLNGKN